QYGKLYAPRPAKVNQLIQRSPHGASGVENIVHQDYRPALDIARQFGAADDWFSSDGRKIVAIQSDIEHPNRRAFAFEIGNLVGNSIGQRHTSAADTNQNQIR